MVNVYKPAFDAKYTREATPDFRPPLITREGKLATIDATTASTYTIYSVPAGYSAKLIQATQVQLNLNINLTLNLDGQKIFFKSLATTEYTQPPFIALTYETAIPIRQNLQMVYTGAGTRATFSFIIVEERLINN